MMALPQLWSTREHIVRNRRWVVRHAVAERALLLVNRRSLGQRRLVYRHGRGARHLAVNAGLQGVVDDGSFCRKRRIGHRDGRMPIAQIQVARHRNGNDPKNETQDGECGTIQQITPI